MRFRGLLACLICSSALAVPAVSSESGLNAIPTTDTVHYRRLVLELENGNTSFETPSFRQAPHLEYGSQFGFTRRIEGGVDYVQPEDAENEDNDNPSYEFALNLKYKMRFESRDLPNMAVGVTDVGRRQRPSYYLTFSKTLNYLSVQRLKVQEEKAQQAANSPDLLDTPTTHHHSQDVFGQRIHAGLLYDGKNTVQPFLGVDIVLDNHWLIQSDWINGSGNAITFGAEYTFPNKKTAINPYLLFSNDTHRIDGFALNISDEFRLGL